MTKAEQGHSVKLHYTGSFESGEKFDSSHDRGEPIAFDLGEGQIISGLEDAVIGMEQGDSKTVTIPPEQAYGDRREDLMFNVGRDQVPGNVELEKGMRLTGTTDQGQQVELMVVDFNDESVTLDANHPLAGQTLVFDIELVDVSSSEKAE